MSERNGSPTGPAAPPGEADAGCVVLPTGERVRLLDTDPAATGLPPRMNPPGRMVTLPNGELIYVTDRDGARAEDAAPTAGAEAPPIRMNPPGRTVTLPNGEQIFVTDRDGSPAPAAGAAAPPIRMNPPGRLVTLPDGEQVFVTPQGPAPSPTSPSDPSDPSAPSAPVAPVAAVAAAPEARVPDAPAPVEAGGGDGAADGATAAPRVPPAPPRRARGPALAPSPPAEAGGIEIRDDGLQEIIAAMPSRTVRWGSGVMAGVMVAVLGMAAVIRYPTLMAGPVSVTTPTPPVRVAVPAGGEIESVLVGDRQAVAPGAVLAVLRSAARYEEVMRLRATLAGAVPGAELAPASAGLGELQQPVSAYEAALAAWRAFRDDRYHEARMAALREQVAHQTAIYASARGRLPLLESDVALAEREWRRAQELVRQGLGPATDADKAEAAWLSRRAAVEAGRDQVTSQQLRITEIESQALTLQQARADEETRLRLNLMQALAAVREAVAGWESRFLLRAPIAGRVSFFRPLSVGLFVSAGEPALAVVPEGRRAVGQMRLASDRAGQVRPGQRVILRFDAFPAQQYGTVEGRVERISLVASLPTATEDAASEYLISISLPDGLRTRQGLELPLRQEMGGTAEVVTESRTVLQRMFSRVSEALHRPQ